ncbi:putative NAD dependent epimerase/dehydratase [Patellaria atrata CBS 101060]|uniref:NAD dependent epimerase/dehydratase n=1 Tax=Patellaria atrata CBS 101060 TaxID=1346257 RepID=A0A9P4VUS3_9PEZI|nr:putative NAD dependent epimerase/dehydratase [Patellaria atrata CBS 101060]
MPAEHVLVTGGLGFVGSAILHALLNAHPSFKTTVLDIKPTPLGYKLPSGVNYIQADLRSKSDALRAIRGTKPTVIIHTAGYSPTGSARYSQTERAQVFSINVKGTENILHAAREEGVKAFVYTSTCCVISDDLDHDFPNMKETLPTGRATTVYGQSKTIAEHLVLSVNYPELATCALRPSVIFGPGDTQLIPTLHACIEKGETPFVVGDGFNLTDFTYVDNVSHAHVLALENLLGPKSAAGEAFFITNGQPIPFRDFCLAVWTEFGHIPSYEIRIPKTLAWFAGSILDWVTWMTGKEVTLSAGSVKDAYGVRYASIEKARKVLGYSPIVGLQEGIGISCKDYYERLNGK